MKLTAYETLKKIVRTEKSTLVNENFGKFLIIVPCSASKPDIKSAFESTFNCKVSSVNTCFRSRVVRSFKGKKSKIRKRLKYAYVSMSGKKVDYEALIESVK